MVGIEQLRACPHCESTSFESAVPCEDRLYGLVNGLEYARCHGCGLLFLAARVKEAELEHLYPHDYHPYQSGASADTTGQRRLLDLPARAVLVLFHRAAPDRLRRATDMHYRPPHNGARFLDFGCGSTGFLDKAATLGWAPVGVDFTATVVDAARAAGHEAHLVHDCWDRLGPGSVDALRLNHVLEHLYDPWTTMRQLSSLLAPGGRLHIGVPNPAGLSAMLFGQDWISYDARHTLLYTPAQAERFVLELGFKNVQVVHETISKDLTRSWGYRRVRSAGADRRQVEALAFSPIPNAVVTPVAKVAALLRRADRFHIFATR